MGTLTGTTTSDQSEPGNNGNERVLHNPQSSRSGASPSGNLISYPGHSLGGEESYLAPAEIRSAYSTTLARN